MNDIGDRPTAVAEVDATAFAEMVDDELLGIVLHDTYKVVRFLAEGGMGRVYEAHHTRLENKRFAIKILHTELKHSIEVRMRFRREAEAAASIDHPNVVGVHDFGYAEAGWPYLVCDYLDGIELAEALDKRTRLEPDQCTAIAIQLCRALEAAHEKGVIHRDIKPANVFLVGPPDSPEIRVLDFGLSRVIELSDANMTRSGMVMGTPAYMSPEQAGGLRADHRTDVYGVGAVLYACLTGTPPYVAESPQQVVLSVLARDPVRPCELVPSIPPQLEFIVQKAMARNPDERFSTMKEFEAALARFAEGRSRQMQVASARAGTATTALVGPETEDAEPNGIRRRAIGWLMLAGGLALVGTLSAALGVLAIVAPGRALSPTELLLVALGVLGSLFTPGVLLVRWLRRRFWGNSARMMMLVSAVRMPVMAAIVVYGLVSLVGRMLDVAHPHLRGTPSPDASGWLGWAPLFFALGLLAAGGALMRQRIIGATPTLVRRVVGGPVLIGLLGLLGTSMVVLGYQRGPRAHGGAQVQADADAAFDSGPRSADASESEPPPASGSDADSPQSSPSSSDDDPAAGATPPGATDEELAQAKKGGLPALAALQARYPNDPRVLKSRSLALAEHPSRASELLRVLDVLFLEAPDEANDPELGKQVQLAAVNPATTQRAFDLMGNRMGLRGAEMLFDIVLARPELRQRARNALGTAEVQRRLSPALKIAYDLHITASCTARVELLPQAIEHGDARAIGALKLVTSRTLRGCGYRQKQPCPPPCGKEAPVMKAAMKSIQARLDREAAAKP